MPKIAFLIQAHNEPELCIKLIHQLNHEDSLFFIHWDSKFKKEGETVEKEFTNHKNVFFYSEFEMFWMGISQVKATLLLLKNALLHKFDYCVLLSGQDYPIKPTKDIFEFFEKEKCNFISLNYLKSMGPNFPQKVENYHFLESNLWNPKSSTKNNLMFKIYFSVYLKYVRHWFPKRKMWKNWTPYFGSQWFAFTYNTCKQIIDFVEKNPDYTKFMSTTESPDEMFFHTIIGNTDLISTIKEFDDFKQKTSKYNYIWGSLRFMDWESPNRAKPALLDMRDFEKLKETHFLFCRKVSLKNPDSNALINAIDKIKN